jgi:hypothetical protein
MRQLSKAQTFQFLLNLSKLNFKRNYQKKIIIFVTQELQIIAYKNEALLIMYRPQTTDHEVISAGGGRLWCGTGNCWL